MSGKMAIPLKIFNIKLKNLRLNLFAIAEAKKKVLG